MGRKELKWNARQTLVIYQEEEQICQLPGCQQWDRKERDKIRGDIRKQDEWKEQIKIEEYIEEDEEKDLKEEVEEEEREEKFPEQREKNHIKRSQGGRNANDQKKRSDL